MTEVSTKMYAKGLNAEFDDQQHRHSFPSKQNMSKCLSDVIHSDVCGLAQNETIGGCRYFVTYKDDYLQHTWICPMKSKMEFFSHFVKLKNWVENEKNRKIRCLQSNGGRKYFSNCVYSLSGRQGDSPGILLPVNTTTKDLLGKGCSHGHVSHEWVHGRACPSLHPSQEVFWEKGRPLALEVFGSIAYMHVPDEKRTKLDPKSKKMILVSYSLEQKGYKSF